MNRFKDDTIYNIYIIIKARLVRTFVDEEVSRKQIKCNYKKKKFLIKLKITFLLLT